MSTTNYMVTKQNMNVPTDYMITKAINEHNKTYNNKEAQVNTR